MEEGCEGVSGSGRLGSRAGFGVSGLDPSVGRSLLACRFFSATMGLSLYAVGGLGGLRDLWRRNLGGGRTWLLGGDGVGLRDDTCVIVGETAKENPEVSKVYWQYEEDI